MLVATYGTLKSGRGNNRVLGDSKLIGTGVIEHHRLYQAGIPFVVQDFTSPYKIQVEVYAVPTHQMARVDALEGHPNWYCRSLTEVLMDDGTVLEAQVYKMAERPLGTVENTSGAF